MADGAQRLLAGSDYGAAEAYDRWHNGRRDSWRISKGGDWQTPLQPFADHLAQNYNAAALQPFHLIGACELYREADGSETFRDRCVFIVGGSASRGGASLYLGQIKGFFNKRVEAVLLSPSRTAAAAGGAVFGDYFADMNTSLSGDITVDIQFVDSGLPVLRIGWWGRARHKQPLLQSSRLFLAAMQA